MKRRILTSIISVILCITLLTPLMPFSVSAESGTIGYIRLADLDDLTQVYMSDSEAREAQYPNGAITLVETSAEFEMNQTYAIDIFRQGGTAQEASIKLSSVDMTAGYGEDYRLYLTDQLSDKGVEGSKLLYYYESGVPYVARQTDHEEYYMTQDNTDDLSTARQDASDINDMAAQNMPHSSETVLTFAEGENRKTVFVETMKKDKITDDLEFMLVLSDPENCSVSASVSGVYTIKEQRKKPRSKLDIASTSANPESSEVLVSVNRSGNLGGYDSFRLTTKSDTAQAEKDYVAVAEDLRFAPGISEIKVPIALLDGAEDGRSFTVELSDAAGNADIGTAVATVTLDETQEIVDTGAESKNYVTDFTYKTNSYREYEFVDLSKFHREKVLGDWDDGSARYDSNKWRLDYDQSSWKNHACDAMSPSKLNFEGVKSVRFCYDNAGGSCKWDHAAVALSETNPLDNGDRDCDWMDNLSGSDGVSWSLWDTGPSHLNRTIDSPNGNKFIYLVLHKGGFWGASGVKFHDYTGDKDCSFRLNLQDYHVRIIDPEPVKLFKNGKLESVHAVTNAQFTDPNSTAASYTTEATFYRYDSTTIKAAVDSKYGAATLRGIYICNPDDVSNHSSLITLNGGNFTLSPQTISSYSNYIVNNSFVIQPVYEFDKINLKVESYSDAQTGVSFTADNNSHTGTFTVDGAPFGTVNWSYDSSRNGYYDGDELIFTFTPSQGGESKSVAYEYRCADVESDLKNAQWIKTGTASDKVGITLSRKYFSVSPYITDLSVKNRLIVNRPDGGDFTSKGTKYAAENSDGSVTVTGYYVPGDADHPALDESFDSYAPGRRMEYTANPKSGYYAEWTYTDAVTHQKKTYRGNSFYYTVQNPFHLNDNTVTLSFVPSSTIITKFISAPLNGSITVPKGTILHPVTSSTDIRVPAADAVIYMDGFTGRTDDSGKFTLVSEPGSSAPATVTALGVAKNFIPGMMSYGSQKYSVDETHRALIYYNGNYYISDIKLSAEASSVTSFSVQIELENSSTLGIVPLRTEAFSVDTGIYGDSITLVDARSVNFSVDFDARNIDADKPVNLARWSFESDDGMLRSSMDMPIESGSSTALYSCVVKEKAKPGDHLFIAFYNKSYDSSSNAKYTYYGKFEVGYQFVPANVEEVISYMPDIGFYDEEGPAETGDIASTGTKYAKTPEAPALGPVSPMFSIFGFLPTYSDAATGQKDQKTGKDLYVLEIGVQFSVAKTDTADQNGKWSASSVAKQWDKLAKIIDKSPGELAQNMNTSTKISLTVSFAYQLEYYTNDGGSRCYTQSLFLLGGKIGVRISIPFTIVAIPCFVYFDISADNVGYLVHTPNDKTDGYWTSKMLENSYYYETHGEFSQKFKIQFGVGVGWDGLASIGGHVDFDLNSRIKGTSHGKMTCSVSGGVFAQLLFLKVDKTWNIHEWVLLDTDADIASVGANILNRQNVDLFADTKLSDMDLAVAADIYDDSVNDGKELAPTGSDPFALFTHETYAENNSALMSPVIGKISDTRYLIATVMNSDDQKFVLKYYIYDTEDSTIHEQGSPVSALISANDLSADDEGVRLLRACEDLVSKVNVIDCGDKLLLVWTACNVDNYQNSSIDKAMASFKIVAVAYDKASGRFTDFDVVSTQADTLPDNIKGVYNPSTGVTHIFYESIKTSSVNGDTTLKEVSDLPVSLNTCSIKLSDDTPDFTAPATLDIKGRTLTDYDVSLYEDDVLVSFISAKENSLTVEKPLTTNSSDYNASAYGTQNNMYLVRYDDKGTTLSTGASILIADENHVTANPEFVKLDYHGVENTLLFFKCNGRYGYQNVENLYIQYEHAGWEGALKDDSMKPNYITLDEDHTVGEDFRVYASDDGVLYALWTQSEGTQQQIWGRQFQVDSIEKISAASVIDDSGAVLYDSDGSPKTEELSKPVHILHGFWGNKAQLTTGGMKQEGAEGTGYYKGNFDAKVLDKDHILSVYNSFDYDYGEAEEGDRITTINNRFVITEFDINSWYNLDENVSDAVAVSNPYPTPGETIKVFVHAENNGFSTGRDVTLELMTAGNTDPVDSVSFPAWAAGEEKDLEFEYTVPADIDVTTLDSFFYYRIREGGTERFRSEGTYIRPSSRLSVEVAHAEPVKEITDSGKTAAYHVTARVANLGNIPYKGGDELTFIYNDPAAQADVLNKDVPDTKPFYINFGGIEIPEIGTGSSVELSFVSDEIPESIFDEYHTNAANLKLAITPRDGIGWKEVKGNEPYNFLDELGIGQFEKPVSKEITSISAQALSVPLGSTRFITPSVTPTASAKDAVFSYQSDSDIISIDENGLVKGNKRGTATVTVSCGNVSTQLTVSVVDPEVGDVDLDGEITIFDATVLQRYLIKLQTLSDDALAQADANRDGDITIPDATTIQRYLIKILYSL